MSRRKDLHGNDRRKKRGGILYPRELNTSARLRRTRELKLTLTLDAGRNRSTSVERRMFEARAEPLAVT